MEFGRHHIIDKLRLDITVQKPKRAGALQDRVSRIVRRELKTVLDEIFSDIGGDRYVVLDQLELNLGRLSALSLKEELPAAVRDEVRRELTRVIDSSGVREDVQLWTEIDELYLSVFIHYLRKGTYPWYVSRAMAEGQMENPEKLLHRLLESEYDPLKKKLSEALEDERARSRLAYQFSDHAIRSVLALYSDSAASAFEEVISLVRKRVTSKGPLLRTMTARKIVLEIFHQYELEDRAAEVDTGRLIAEEIKLERLQQFVRLHDARLTRLDKSRMRVDRTWIQDLLRLVGGTGMHGAVRDMLKRFIQVGRDLDERELDSLIDALEKGRTGSEALSDTDEAGRSISEILKGFLDEGEITVDSSLLSELEQMHSRRSRTEDSRRIESPFATEWKASGQKKEEDEPDHYISNAGLVLLWPYVARFFRKLELVVDQDFINESARVKAVHLLQYLVTGSEETYEHLMVLNKVLCGYSLDHPLPMEVEFADSEKEEARQVLQSAIDHWEALKDTSAEGFRDAFLNRNGRLRYEEKEWSLHVETESYDILLDRLPWGNSVVKLPWMHDPLYVEWR